VLLLVDDSKINRKLPEHYARKRKYYYMTAVDGQLAVNAYPKAHEASLLRIAIPN
jgi:CheY-like chemotaxis protein